MAAKLDLKDSSGRKISAILSTPSNKKVPIIILCHGLNSSKESKTNQELDEILAKHGIGTFAFDFFGHGESEGKVEERTVSKFVDDIECAIKFLRERGYNEIGICGASFGGLASSIAASNHPDLKVIALKAPGMGQTSRKMQNYKADFDTKSWITAGSHIQIPTLIVHGSMDTDVELQLGIDLAKSIKSSKLEVVEGADHRFSKKEDFGRMIMLISKFLISNMLKA